MLKSHFTKKQHTSEKLRMELNNKCMPYPFTGPNPKARQMRMTLPEILIALSLTTMLMAVAYPIFIGALKQSKSATWQAQFLNEARAAQQKLNQVVQTSKYLETPDSQTVNLYSSDDVKSVIRYKTDEDGEGILELDPGSGPDKILCRYVSPISESEPIFELQEHPQQNLRVAIHVGDPPDEGGAEAKTGPGYSGVELRFTSSPKDLQEWYN